MTDHLLTPKNPPRKTQAGNNKPDYESPDSLRVYHNAPGTVCLQIRKPRQLVSAVLTFEEARLFSSMIVEATKPDGDEDGWADEARS